MSNVYEFSAIDIDGHERKLEEFRGKTMLIVNVASKCGFTPQYAGLEAIYRKLKDRDFVVLGFPCDQFGHQEPGDEAEIKGFCSLQYEVSFPLFAKIQVNGDGTHPLYRFLKKQAKGLLGSQAVKWNFTKFLVDRHGQVLRRYAPIDKPAKIERDVVAAL